MTTAEIRLKCLELAMTNTHNVPNADNYVIQAKIYENYLLGITEQTIAKKEEPLSINLKDIFNIGNDKFEIKDEVINVLNSFSKQQFKDFENYLSQALPSYKSKVSTSLDSEGYGSLESYTKRLSGTCKHH